MFVCMCLSSRFFVRMCVSGVCCVYVCVCVGGLCLSPWSVCIRKGWLFAKCVLVFGFVGVGVIKIK